MDDADGVPPFVFLEPILPRLMFRRMDVTLSWFICICLEKEILQPAAVALLRKSAKVDDDAVAYGEKMLNIGIIGDSELLKSVLEEARDRAASEALPPFDPFAPPEAISAPPAREAPPPPPPSMPQSMVETASPRATHDFAEKNPEETTASTALPSPGIPDFSTLMGAGDGKFREAMTALLLHASGTGASDLHLSAGARPFVRRDRENVYLDPEPLSAEVAEGLNRALLSEAQWAAFQQNQDLDFALPFPSGERYRANLMVHKDGCAGTYRTVSPKIRSLAELGFRNPETIDKLLSYHNGLIIVAGPVGSGKTTTLAALVHQLNQTRDDHLISVEEPIEFVHQPGRCIITQRGVSEHTRTFHSALKGALRQDPDIIVIGEMRDLETVEMAISASETGHLVIGTMHTSDAATTLNRLLDVFPPAQQPQIRAMVAESLRGIICQRLLPAKDGGLVLAGEVLLRNMAVSALIREGKTQGLGNVMETGKAEGMMTMDSSVLSLWREGRLADEIALGNLRSEIAGREIRKPVSASPPNGMIPATPPEPKRRGFFNRT